MPLVFPQAKPIGVNSTSSQDAIRSEAAFPTQVIDYLKFDMFHHKDNKQYGDSIYLYLPKQLTEQYTQKWGKAELGPEGSAILDAASTMIGSDDISKEDFSKEIDEQVEINAHYRGYLKKQKADILAFKRDENLIIPEKIDYDKLSGLSNEVKAKFNQIKPKTMGQALRIDGITPAAVYILLSHVKRKSIKHIA